MIDDVVISRAIIDSYFEKLKSVLELDVALVGAGPSNLVAGYFLARAGIKTALFESKLAPGGGMWGGGMMFNEIVVQSEAAQILEELGVACRKYRDDYWIADSVGTVSALIFNCVKQGTKIFNLIKAVDVLFREDQKNEKRVSGLVLQWTPVEHLNLHVDPLSVSARYVVDGSGHPAEICQIICRKMDTKLWTRTGGVVGEMSMWAEKGETETIKNSGEVFPGVYVLGMAANAVKGAPRMGPVFGSMILSGRKVAEELVCRLK